jgi:RHS repeat-associated protein
MKKPLSAWENFLRALGYRSKYGKKPRIVSRKLKLENLESRELLAADLVQDEDLAIFIGDASVWNAGGLAGAYENDYLAAPAGDGSSKLQWQIDGLDPGEYQLFTTYLPHSNRAKDATFTIIDGTDAEGEWRISQRIAPNDLVADGSNWESIGTYQVDNGTLTIELSNQSSTGYVIADAIKLVPITPTTDPIETVDDGDAHYNEIGSGWYGTGSLSDGFNSDYRYSWGTSEKAISSFELENLDSSQNYQVLTTWVEASNRSKVTPYQIWDGEAEAGTLLATLTVNQQQNPSSVNINGKDWQVLGYWKPISGKITVTISNDINDSSKVVIADAVKALPFVEPTDSPEIIDNGDFGFATEGGTWNFGSLSDGYQGDYQYYFSDGTGNNKAIYTYHGLIPGQAYVIQTTFSHANNRTKNAPYTVASEGNVVLTSYINQRIAPNDATSPDGRAWEGIGVVTAGASGELVIQLSDSGVNSKEVIIADAVRVMEYVPVTEISPITIIDDGDPEFENDGVWSNGSLTTGYGGDYKFVTTSTTGEEKARFVFNGLTPGQEVQIQTTWVSGSTRGSAVPHTIIDGGVPVETINVDQRFAPDDISADGHHWGILKDSYTVTGTTLVIELNNDSPGTYVIADAARLVVSTPPANYAPTTSGIPAITTVENGPDTEIDLSTYFADAEQSSDTLTYTIEQNTNSGLVTTTLVDGLLTLTYLTSQSGTAAITVRATDDQGEFVETVLNVTVDPNTPPTSSGISDIEVIRDADDTIIDLSAVFSDENQSSETLTYSVTANDNVALVATSISGSDLALAYTLDAFGTATITVRATDSADDFVEATFSVQVNQFQTTSTVNNTNELVVVEGETLLITGFSIDTSGFNSEEISVIFTDTPITFVDTTGVALSSTSNTQTISGTVDQVNTVLAAGIIYTPVINRGVDGFIDMQVVATDNTLFETVSTLYEVLERANPLDSSVYEVVLLEQNGGDANTGFVIDHYDYGAGKGFASVGDVDNDGYTDFVVKSWGNAYLVFGAEGRSISELTSSDLANNAVEIGGFSEPSSYGAAAAHSNMDINADGYADMIFGGTNVPNKYVVYGRERANFGSSITIGTLAANEGFKISTSITGDSIGGASASDINADGFDDLVVAYNGADIQTAAYVIYGSDSLGTEIDVTQLSGSDGFAYKTYLPTPHTFNSATAIGDINNDGFDEIAIGGRSSRVDIIYGGNHLTSPLYDENDLDGIFGVKVEVPGWELHYNPTSGGDYNGDGIDDLYLSNTHAHYRAGEVIVAYGGANFSGNPILDLTPLDPSEGVNFIGVGSNTYHSAGGEVGDLDGDGFDDLFFSSAITPANLSTSGQINLIFGGTTSSIDLEDLDGTNGISFAGAFRGDQLYIGGQGLDFDGDGLKDWLAATPSNSFNTKAGYLLYGQDYRSNLSQTGSNLDDSLIGTSGADGIIGAQGNDSIVGNGGSDVLYGGQGDDTISISDLNYQRIDGGTGTDTLRFDFSSQIVDFQSLGLSRTRSIEVLSFTGTGNVLTIRPEDVVTLTNGKNTYEGINLTNALVLTGDYYQNTINNLNEWTLESIIQLNGVDYNKYTSGEISLIVDQSGFDTGTDPIPTYQVSTSSDTTEGGTVEFTISLDSIATVDLVFNYQISGSAVSGEDYNSPTGSLTIPAGNSSGVVSIGTIDDTEVESTKTIGFSIQDINGESVSPAVYTVNLLDNDLRKLQFSTPLLPTVTENVSSTQIEVVLDQPAADDITFEITPTESVDGDISLSQTSFTIPAGQTSVVINVDIEHDADSIDDNITFTLTNLSSNAIIDTYHSASLTVLDVDSIPGVGFQHSSAMASEEQMYGYTNLILDRVYAHPVEVEYHVYEAGNLIQESIVTIPAGTTSRSVGIPIPYNEDHLERQITATIFNIVNGTAAFNDQFSLNIESTQPPLATVLFNQGTYKEGDEVTGTVVFDQQLSAEASNFKLAVDQVFSTTMEGIDIGSNLIDLNSDFTFSFTLPEDELFDDDKRLVFRVTSDLPVLNYLDFYTNIITDPYPNPSDHYFIRIEDLNKDTKPQATLHLASTLTEKTHLAHITLDEVRPETTVVNYSIIHVNPDGEPTEDEDFYETSGTIEIPAYTLLASFEVQIVEDDIYEDVETLVSDEDGDYYITTHEGFEIKLSSEHVEFTATTSNERVDESGDYFKQFVIDDSGDSPNAYEEPEFYEDPHRYIGRLRIIPVNTDADLVKDYFVIEANEEFSGSVRTNDNLTNGDLEFVSSTGPGELDFSPNGDFTYTPPENFHGQFSFIYKNVDNITCTATLFVGTQGTVDPLGNHDIKEQIQILEVSANDNDWDIEVDHAALFPDYERPSIEEWHMRARFSSSYLHSPWYGKSDPMVFISSIWDNEAEAYSLLMNSTDGIEILDENGLYVDLEEQDLNSLTDYIVDYSILEPTIHTYSYQVESEDAVLGQDYIIWNGLEGSLSENGDSYDLKDYFYPYEPVQYYTEEGNEFTAEDEANNDFYKLYTSAEYTRARSIIDVVPLKNPDRTTEMSVTSTQEVSTMFEFSEVVKADFSEYYYEPTGDGFFDSISTTTTISAVEAPNLGEFYAESKPYYKGESYNSDYFTYEVADRYNRHGWPADVPFGGFGYYDAYYTDYQQKYSDESLQPAKTVQVTVPVNLKAFKNHFDQYGIFQYQEELYDGAAGGYVGLDGKAILVEYGVGLAGTPIAEVDFNSSDDAVTFNVPIEYLGSSWINDDPHVIPPLNIGEDRLRTLFQQFEIGVDFFTPGGDPAGADPGGDSFREATYSGNLTPWEFPPYLAGIETYIGNPASIIESDFVPEHNRPDAKRDQKYPKHELDLVDADNAPDYFISNDITTFAGAGAVSTNSSVVKQYDSWGGVEFVKFNRDEGKLNPPIEIEVDEALLDGLPLNSFDVTWQLLDEDDNYLGYAYFESGDPSKLVLASWSLLPGLNEYRLHYSEPNSDPDIELDKYYLNINLHHLPEEGHSFDNNWRMADLSHLIVTDEGVTWVSPTDDYIVFKKDDSDGYITPEDVNYVLTKSSEGFELNYLNLSNKVVFDEEGKQIRIELANGTPKIFEYEEDAEWWEVSKITDFTGVEKELKYAARNVIYSDQYLQSITSPSNYQTIFTPSGISTEIRTLDQNDKLVSKYIVGGTVTNYLTKYSKSSSSHTALGTAINTHDSDVPEYDPSSEDETGVGSFTDMDDSFTYQTDEFGNITEIIRDRDGEDVVTKFHRREDGVLLSVTRPAPGGLGEVANQESVTTYEYGSEDSVYPEAIILPGYSSDQKIILTWDESVGQPTSITYPNGLVENYLYTGGNLTSYSRPGAYITYSNHDALGRPQQIVEDYEGLDSIVTKVTYYTSNEGGPLSGLVKSIEEAVGDSDKHRTTEFLYSSSTNRLEYVRLREGSGGALLNEYNYVYSDTEENGKKVQVFLNGKKVGSSQLNDAGHVQATVGRFDDSAHFKLDKAGRVISSMSLGQKNLTDGVNSKSATTYDGFRTKSVSSDLGLSVSLHEKFQSTPYLMAYSDASYNTEIMTFDKWDRPVEVRGPDGTKFIEYDAYGDVKKVHHPDPNVGLVPFYPLTQVPTGEFSVETFYDRIANYETIFDNTGIEEVTRTNYYDTVGNLFQSVSGNQTTQYQYYGNGAIRQIDVLDTDGRFSSTSFEYDRIGNLVQETLHSANGPSPQGFVTQYTYDRMGRVSQVTDAFNNLTTYLYYTAGEDHFQRVKEIKSPARDGSSEVISTFFYYSEATSTNPVSLPNDLPSGDLLDKANEAIASGRAFSATYTKSFVKTGVYAWNATFYNQSGEVYMTISDQGKSTAAYQKFDFDEYGRLSKTVDSDQRYQRYQYSGAMQEDTTVTNSFGETYFQDSSVRSSSYTSSLTGTTTTDRDYWNRVTSIDAPGESSDPNIRVRYIYDPSVLTPAQQTVFNQAVNSSLTISQVRTLTNSLTGASTLELYNENGQVVVSVGLDHQGGAPVTTYSYYPSGSLASMTSPDGIATNYQTDDIGRVVIAETWDAANNLIETVYFDTVYSLSGLPLTSNQQSALSASTFNNFAYGRLLTRNANNNTTTQLDLFNAIGQKIGSIGPDAGWNDGITVQHWYYNSQGLVDSYTSGLAYLASDPHAVRLSYTYDLIGRVISETQWSADQSESIINQYQYEVPISGILDSGQTIAQSQLTAYYQARKEIGFFTGYSDDMITTDPYGRVTITMLDAKGRVIREIHDEVMVDGSPSAPVVKYDYNDFGRQQTITDPAGNTTTFSFDLRGRIIQEDITADGETLTRSYSYNNQGLLASYTDRNGRVTKYSYYNNGQLNLETWYENVADAAAGTNAVKTIDFDYFGLTGLLQSITDGSDLVQFSYDTFSRIDIIDFYDGTNSFSIDYDFNPEGQLTDKSFSLTAGGVTNNYTNSFERDLLDRVRTLTQSGLNVGPSKTVWFDYYANGQLESIGRSEGGSPISFLTTSYGYDGFNRLDDLQHATASGTFDQYQWDFYADGRIENFRQWNIGNQNFDETHYDYNANYQLTEVFLNGSSVEQFDYDINGNRDGDGYDTDENNLMSQSPDYTYQYDNENNRVRRDHTDGSYTSYEYDHRNRLTSLIEFDLTGTKVKEVEYDYDVFNNRTEKRLDLDGDGSFEDGSIYFYDGSHIAMATNLNGDLSNRYLHGPAVDQILADESFDPASGLSEDILWALTDHQGSVRDLVSYESSNNSVNLIEHLHYDAFGNLINIDTNERLTSADRLTDHLFSYTGREHDLETDLMYYRARYYESSTGIFISEDPIKDGLNWTAYVSNNPINNVDPSGLAEMGFWESVGTAIQDTMLFTGSKVAKVVSGSNKLGRAVKSKMISATAGTTAVHHVELVGNIYEWQISEDRTGANPVIQRIEIGKKQGDIIELYSIYGGNFTDKKRLDALAESSNFFGENPTLNEEYVESILQRGVDPITPISNQAHAFAQYQQTAYKSAINAAANALTLGFYGGDLLEVTDEDRNKYSYDFSYGVNRVASEFGTGYVLGAIAAGKSLIAKVAFTVDSLNNTGGAVRSGYDIVTNGLSFGSAVELVGSVFGLSGNTLGNPEGVKNIYKNLGGSLIGKNLPPSTFSHRLGAKLDPFGENVDNAIGLSQVADDAKIDAPRRPNPAHSAASYEQYKLQLTAEEIANPGDAMRGPVVVDGFNAPKVTTASQEAQLREYASLSTLAEREGYLSPTGRVSTQGAIESQAARARVVERERARLAGTPYVLPNVAAHAPDSGWLGYGDPPFWHFAESRVNSTVAGQQARYPIGYKPTRFIFRGDLPNE